jgi:hypothetical protein
VLTSLPRQDTLLSGAQEQDHRQLLAEKEGRTRPVHRRCNMMFSKKKNKVKVKFEFVVLRAINLPSKLNGRDVKVAWSKGKRKSNKGESEPVAVQNGSAIFDYGFTIEASLSQDASSQHFESKKIAFYLRVRAHAAPKRSDSLVTK